MTLRVYGRILFMFSALGFCAQVHGQSAPVYSLDYQGPPIGAASANTPCIKAGDMLVGSLPGWLPPVGPAPIPWTSTYGGPRGPLANLGLPSDPILGPFCPPPGMAVGFPGPGPVEIDAMSYGVDYLIGSQPWPVSLTFSVDEFATGVAAAPAPPNVFTEGPLGGPGEASADVFIYFPILPAAFPAGPGMIAPGNTQLFDGNGIGAPGIIPPPFGPGPRGLGLTEPNFPPGIALPDPGSNLDALDVDAAVTAVGVAPFPAYFSLDAAFADPLEGPVPAPPNTNSAATNGAFFPGDVLVTFVSGGPIAVYAPSLLLGLDIIGGPGSDDLDALALAENGMPGYQPSMAPMDWVGGATDMLLFSVRRGSMVIGAPDSCFGAPIEPGDILTRPIAGGGTPFPCIFMAAENLGLSTTRSAGAMFGDDVDALDVSADCQGNFVPDLLDIAYGFSADFDGNAVPDTCQCPVPPPGMTKGADDTCFAGGIDTGTPCGQNSDCAAGQLCRVKNRFITTVTPPVVMVSGLKVTIVGLDAGSVGVPANYAGFDRWVGAPSLGVADGVSPPFNAAALQCGFYSQDWSTVGQLHMYGDVVAPLSTYDTYVCCDASGPATCSPSVRVATARFGDVVTPLNVTNFQDISAVVAKFQGTPAGPSKTRTKFREPVNPLVNINFQEIAMAVSAFQGNTYLSQTPAAPVCCPGGAPGPCPG